MTPTATVVFGDDGSPAADLAWLLINSHRWPAWNCQIVTANPPEIPRPLPRELTELHPWTPPNPRRRFSDAQFTAVSDLTTMKDPRVALSQECDLLVIGDRGPGLLKALRLGSTAEWLLAHPPAPLLIARHGQMIRRVVLCADGSPHADRVATALAGLPWASELDITVLAVDDGHVDPDRVADVAAARLSEVGATVETCVRIGKPTAEIDRQLTTSPPDLVALGTRGYTGIRHLRVGSTARAITHSTSCSVLLACDDPNDESPTRIAEGGSRTR